MTSPIAYHNGEFIPAEALSVSVYDAGFVLGATIAEQMRTFSGTLFRLREHLDRFERSLAIIGVKLPQSREDLASAAEKVAAENHALLETGDDLGLCLFATSGPYAAMAPPGEHGPTVAMHTFPVAFGTFARKYAEGQSLVSSGAPQIPATSLPRELKCRSRMHYYLADREAASLDQTSRALLLDTDGCVLETTTANILIYRDGGGLISPPKERILPGISLAATLEIAERMGLTHAHRKFSLNEFRSADEAMLTSTSVCALPVVAIDGHPIGDGRPGPVFRQVLAGWGELTGMDVARQAARFASRLLIDD